MYTLYVGSNLLAYRVLDSVNFACLISNIVSVIVLSLGFNFHKVREGLGGKVNGVNGYVVSWKTMSIQGYGIDLGGWY